MPDRIRILLLIPHLGGGGAEHVISTLACHLDPARYEIHLGLVTQSSNAYPPPPEWVTIHPLNSSRVRYGAFKLVRLIWLLRPAVILSGMAHLNLLVLMLRPFLPSKTCICVRQNGALSATLSDASAHRTRLFFAAAYRSANRVICQTPAMAAEFHQLGVNPRKINVLHNPVDLDGIRALGSATRVQPASASPRLVAVARLATEKGLDMLLEAFAGLLKDYPAAELDILGKGPCESALKAQCTSLALHDHVHFRGEVSLPAEHFGAATAFVLSSRHEGLPNALLEAAAAGLPIIALPASAGLVALITGQSGVWLATEISAAALRNALSEAVESIPSTPRFRHSWIEPFDRRRAIPAYQDMIEAVFEESHA
jgi:glycosyltransferase involved in cell wall biosynthesis